MDALFENEIKNNNKFDKFEINLIDYKIKKKLIKKTDLEELILIKNKLEYNMISEFNNIFQINQNCKKNIIKINKYNRENNLELANIAFISYYKKTNINVSKTTFNNKEAIIYLDDLKLIPKSNTEIIDNKEKFHKFIDNQTNKKVFFENLMLSILLNSKNTILISKDSNEIPIFIEKKTNRFIFSNLEIEYEKMIQWLFEDYYYDISTIIFNITNKKMQFELKSIYNITLNNKILDKQINKINTILDNIKTLNDERIKRIFVEKNILKIEDLLDYMSEKFEYGTIVNLFDKNELIPFGTLESNESFNNKIINYDNDDIIALINKYYKLKSKKINPNNENISQFIKNISTISYIIKEDYMPNNPVDVLTYRVGNSLEQMELIALFLRLNKIEFKKFSISEVHSSSLNKHKLIDTQFIIAAFINNKWCYVENSLYSFKGIHEFDNLEELYCSVFAKIIYFRERNIDKEVCLGKYIITDVTNLNLYDKYEILINNISNIGNINISDILTRYKIENEIRKNIVLGKTTAYINFNEKLNIGENNTKTEIIDKLSENILHILYKDNNEGTKFYMIKNNEINYFENKQEKSFKIYFIILLIIIIITILFII